MCCVYIHRFKVLHTKNSPSNRLVVTDKKVTKKSLYGSKEENEEMSKSKTKISTRMYLRHVITWM